MNIRSEFADYLIARGYKVKTPKGKPSTVPNYINSIDLICKRENCSWEELARNVFKVYEKYQQMAAGANIEEKRCKTVINALIQFKKYCFDYCNI